MGRTELVKFRIEPDLKARLVAAADHERRTTSDLLRLIIEQWLDTNQR